MEVINLARTVEISKINDEPLGEVEKVEPRIETRGRKKIAMDQTILNRIEELRDLGLSYRKIRIRIKKETDHTVSIYMIQKICKGEYV